MKRAVMLVVSLVVSCAISAHCLEIPDNLRAEVASAMKDGNALYEAYLKGPAASEQTDGEKAKVDDFCEFKYNSYLANNSIYFLAQPSSSYPVIVGRHYRLSQGTIVKSTKTCFALQVPPNDNVKALFTTHLLSDAPTEFYVFLSLCHQRPIYVRTRVGIWKIEGGRIAFLEKRDS